MRVSNCLITLSAHTLGIDKSGKGRNLKDRVHQQRDKITWIYQTWMWYMSMVKEADARTPCFE